VGGGVEGGAGSGQVGRLQQLVCERAGAWDMAAASARAKHTQ